MFKRIFLNENIWILKYVFVETWSLGSNWQYVSIGSDNGSAPSRRQAIIWTNTDPFHRRIYAALGGDELIIYYFRERQASRPKLPWRSPKSPASHWQCFPSASCRRQSAGDRRRNGLWRGPHILFSFVRHGYQPGTGSRSGTGSRVHVR